MQYVGMEEMKKVGQGEFFCFNYYRGASVLSSSEFAYETLAQAALCIETRLKLLKFTMLHFYFSLMC
jgi:hypothetical protein